MKQLVGQARETARPPLTAPLKVEFKTSIEPPTAWDRTGLEAALSISLTDDQAELWNTVSSMSLFVDQSYGQWGLVLLPPPRAIELTLQQNGRRLARDSRPGDLVIGEFLGDCEYLLLRCDRGESDFGNVLVELPLDRRADWFALGALREFLAEYLRCRGDKYWTRSDLGSSETRPKSCSPMKGSNRPSTQRKR